TPSPATASMRNRPGPSGVRLARHTVPTASMRNVGSPAPRRSGTRIERTGQGRPGRHSRTCSPTPTSYHRGGRHGRVRRSRMRRAGSTVRPRWPAKGRSGGTGRCHGARRTRVTRACNSVLHLGYDRPMSESATSAPVDGRRSAAATRRRKREKEILAATRRLFDERGVRDVHIDDIAKAVGTNRAIIYRHFSGKEELFALTLVGYLDELLERMGAIEAD